MPQIDVFNFLEEQRLVSEKFFTLNEIKIALHNRGAPLSTIKKCHSFLIKMIVFDLIEYKGVNIEGHYKVFRAKKPSA